MTASQAFIAVFTQFKDHLGLFISMFIGLFILFYYVCRVFKDNNATKLIPVYICILFLEAFCAFFLPATVSPWIFLIACLLTSMFMLLLFSVEIKRSVWATKNGDETVTTDDVTTTAVRPETEACINAIVRACQNMSKNDIGALIVLSHGNLPKQVIESGTAINADISQQLVEGIFFPKAPLHDGALIIEDHKLLAAGCFLPLTQNNEKYSKDLGTRHRAGIGITEVTNVVSIIVSEETGIISIVDKGKITRYADESMLRATLHGYYKLDYQADVKKKFRTKF